LSRPAAEGPEDAEIESGTEEGAGAEGTAGGFGEGEGFVEFGLEGSGELVAEVPLLLKCRVIFDFFGG